MKWNKEMKKEKDLDLLSSTVVHKVGKENADGYVKLK